MEALKYPVGRFAKPDVFIHDLLQAYISEIRAFPEKLKQEVEPLSEEQLDTPYRPGGWTVRQVVNHCSDSHMNALIRVKLALTEDKPVITAYKQELWAELADSKTMPIQAALHILAGVHERWCTVLESLKAEQWTRSFIHPEYGKEITLQESAGNYAWHCRHHLAHVTALKKRKTWT